MVDVTFLLAAAALAVAGAALSRVRRLEAKLLKKRQRGNGPPRFPGRGKVVAFQRESKRSKE